MTEQQWSPEMDVKKHIVIYSPGAYSKYGHAFDYVQGVSGALSKHSVEIHVLGWNGPLSLVDSTHEHRIVPSNKVSARREYRRTGLLGDILWGLSRLQMQRELINELRRLAESIYPESYVIFETFEYSLVARLLRNSDLGQRAACIIHDTNFNTKQNSLAATLYKVLMRTFVRQLLHSAQRTYVHGEAMKRNLIASINRESDESLAAKIRVLPYGAPHPETVARIESAPAREALGLPQDQRILLMFGTLRRDKDYDLILRSLSLSQGWLLLVAGPEGDYAYRDLRGLAERHRVRDRLVIFSEFITSDKHALYFGAADVVACIYDPSIRHESGTAHRVRSYLKPIIAGGPPDLVDYVESNQVGWVAHRLTPEAIAIQLEEIGRLSPNQWASMHQHIYHCAVERSWDSVAKLILHDLSILTTQ